MTSCMVNAGCDALPVRWPRLHAAISGIGLNSFHTAQVMANTLDGPTLPPTAVAQLAGSSMCWRLDSAESAHLTSGLCCRLVEHMLGGCARRQLAKVYTNANNTSSVAPLTRLGSKLQVVVHNLPWSTTWQELKDAFAETGPIERADVILDAAGRSRWVVNIAGGSIAATCGTCGRWLLCSHWAECHVGSGGTLRNVRPCGEVGPSALDPYSICYPLPASPQGVGPPHLMGVFL